MLRALFTYYAGAFAVQMVTGVLTLLVDMWASSKLSLEDAGHFRHFGLVYMVFAGPFIVGIDHALVTFIHAAEANYTRFLRLFLTYATAVTAGFAAFGLILLPFVETSTFLGLLAVGPFLVVNLGLIILRTHLDKRREFGLLLAQSLIWSLGTLATLWMDQSAWIPIAWTLAAFLFVSTFLGLHFGLEVRRQRLSLFVWPWSKEYLPFWQRFRPLWIAGAAFLANTHITGVLIDIRFGMDQLAKWGFVGVLLLFMQKPLQLVQRAALPVFSREKGRVWDGFRILVRVNLIVFPILALGLLAAFPLILSFGTLAEKYSDTWILLAVVVAASPMTAVEFLVACVSMAQGHNQNNRDAHVFAALVNVPSTALLIWSFGLFGAAAGAALYVVVFGGAMFWFSRKNLRDYVRFAFRQLVVAMVCLVGGVFVMSIFENKVVGFLPAAAVFLSGSWVLRLWSVSQLKTARDLLFAARRVGITES